MADSQATTVESQGSEVSVRRRGMKTRAVQVNTVTADIDKVQRFLRDHGMKYSSGMDILMDVVTEGAALDFVQFAMDIKVDRRYRKTMEQVSAGMLAFNTPVWLTRFCSRLWNLYLAMLHMAGEVAYRHVIRRPELENSVTKAQRKAMRTTGMVRHRRVQRAVRVDAAQRNLDLLMAIGTPVMWVDNYNKSRYSKSPEGARNLSISATAVAIHVGIRNEMETPEWPDHFALLQKVVAVIGHIPAGLFGMMQDVNNLIQLHRLDFKDIRVPLDKRRRDVVAPPWWPVELHHEFIGTTQGMVNVLDLCVGLSDKVHRRPFPLLADVDIFLRLAKSVYGVSSAEMHITAALRGQFPLFGCWHAYKYCVDLTAKLFRTFFAAVQEDDFCKAPEKLAIYNFNKLIFQERTVACMYLAYPALKTELTLAKQKKTGEVALQFSMLTLLLEHLVPALVNLGIRMRSLAWEHQNEGSGVFAKALLNQALIYILQVTQQRPNKGNQYIRGITVALALWSPFHDNLPGSAFCEEHCEAMLSRLSRAGRHDLTNEALFGKVGF